MNFNQLTAVAAAAAANNPAQLNSLSNAFSSLIANSNMNLADLANLSLGLSSLTNANLGQSHNTSQQQLQSHHHQQQQLQNSNSRSNLHQSQHHQNRSSGSAANSSALGINFNSTTSYIPNSMANLQNADNASASLAMTGLPVSLTNLTNSALTDLPTAAQHSSASGGGRSNNQLVHHRNSSSSNHHNQQQQQQHHLNNHQNNNSPINNASHQVNSSLSKSLAAAAAAQQSRPTATHHRKSSTPSHQPSTNSQLNIMNHKTTNNNNNTHDEFHMIRCKLCNGCLIDAVTLDLCMHSFCKACIVKNLEAQQYKVDGKDVKKCPECYVEIKQKNFRSRLKPDIYKQTLAYSLTGIYNEEMKRRKEFYLSRPPQKERYLSEMFGDVPASKLIKDEDMINVELKLDITGNNPEDPIRSKIENLFLSLRADTTISTIRKLVLIKFGLDGDIKLYYKNNWIYFDSTTLKEIAAQYDWDPSKGKFLEIEIKEEANSLISVRSSG